MQMPAGQVQHDFTASTLATSIRTLIHSSPLPIVSTDIWQQSVHEANASPGTSIIININDGGSTGRGILIGILSAFGSAGVAVLVLAIFFFFRYTNRGRILLDRIGRPGEFDDEQAFAKEEAEALESMDDLQRAEYLRAKGIRPGTTTICMTDTNSVHPSQSTRDCADRHLSFPVPCDPREGCFSVGV